MTELKNSKQTYLGSEGGRDFYHLCAVVGTPLQYRPAPDQAWMDNKPRLERQPNGTWVVRDAFYDVSLDVDGGRIIYPDKFDHSKCLIMPAVPLIKTLTKAVEYRPAALDRELVPSVIKMATAWGYIAFVFRADGLRFHVYFDKAPPMDRITLDIDSIGLPLPILLRASSGLRIPRPRLMEVSGDLEAKERWLEWSPKAGRLELELDFSGLKFPVLLGNATFTVGASADDDQVYRLGSGAPGWNNTATYARVGYGTSINYAEGSSMRFTGVNIPNGATILTCALALICSSSDADVVIRSDLCFENSLNPVQTTSYANHIGRVRTADVEWDNIGAWTAGTTYNSIDFSPCLQTVVDDQGGTGDAVIAFWEDKDNRTDQVIGHLRPAASWDNVSYNPPQLNVTWSTAGTTGYRDIATRFRSTVRAYKDTATRHVLTATMDKDIGTRFGARVLAYKDIGTRFLTRAQAFMDVGTRYRVAVQAFADAATRYRLTVQGYQDAAVRFLLWVQGNQDVGTRFLTYARAFIDVGTRFTLWVREYGDAGTRFLTRAQGFMDAVTRYGVLVQGYRDTLTRFPLHAQAFMDVGTRFRLQAGAYKDTLTRFLLSTFTYVDMTTRYILSVLNYQDIATRFVLYVQGYQDIATRFRLAAQGFIDISTRFALEVQGFADIATRFRLVVQGYRDVATRFLLHVQGYKDAVTRYILSVLNYQDIATRFQLSTRVALDVNARFSLRLLRVYPIIGGRHIVR